MGDDAGEMLILTGGWIQPVLLIFVFMKLNT